MLQHQVPVSVQVQQSDLKLKTFAVHISLLKILAFKTLTQNLESCYAFPQNTYKEGEN